MSHASTDRSPASTGLEPMVMRLTLGHVEGFDDTIAAFAQQLGLTGIQFHTPSDLAGRSGTGSRTN